MLLAFSPASCHSIVVQRSPERRRCLARCASARQRSSVTAGAGALKSDWTAFDTQTQPARHLAEAVSASGFSRVHKDPDICVVRSLLSDIQCQSLVDAAVDGQLTPISYQNAVVLDRSKLWPLVLVVLSGASLHMQHMHGQGLDWRQVCQAGAQAAGLWAFVITALAASAQRMAESAFRDHLFTGSKWRMGPTAGEPAKAAATAFLGKTAQLLQTTTEHLEPATVTRYAAGQYQRKHTDGRHPSDYGYDSAAYTQAGGQRLAQCLVYLNTVPPELGGGTKFHHPLFQGLTISPRQGDALVFFTARQEDGQEDVRLVHSGEKVLGNGEKWIINTWACQFPRGTSECMAREPSKVSI